MSEEMRAARRRVVDAVRKRLFLRDRMATGILVAAIMLWYLVQIGALFLDWSPDRLRWLFTTASFPRPSPGLLFATLSHQFPPHSLHLFGNVVVLWLFAGESEHHMRAVEVVAFFAVSGLAAVLIGTAISDHSTMGASGAVFGFVAFYTVHLILEHRDKFEFVGLKSHGLTATPLQTYWELALVLIPLVLPVYLLGQFAGVVPVGRADVVGHLTGFLCGVGYAMIRRKRGACRSRYRGDRVSA